MDAQLVQAIRVGNRTTVGELLRPVPPEALAGDLGSALLRVAALAGQHELVGDLIGNGADPSRAWPGGVLPVLWAADHGASGVLGSLLGSGMEAWDPHARLPLLRAALETAQAWLDVDPVQELRRRLGVADGEPVTVEHERIRIGEYDPCLTRITVTAADGRQESVFTGHRAVVTQLEAQLGLPAAFDVLAGRATWWADPESEDWSEVSLVMTHGRDRDATLAWALDHLDHAEAPMRHLAAEVLHSLGIDLANEDGEEARCRQLADILRPRLWAETDPETLEDVIAAFGWCSVDDPTAELIPHAEHPDPGVRARVAVELAGAVNHPRSQPPADVVEALVRLGRDADLRPRRAALRTLSECRADTLEVRDLLAEHLTHDDPELRFEAVAGLALREDPGGLRMLRAWTRSIPPDSPDREHWELRVDVVDRLLRYRREHEQEREDALPASDRADEGFSPRR